MVPVATWSQGRRGISFAHAGPVVLQDEVIVAVRAEQRDDDRSLALVGKRVLERVRHQLVDNEAERHRNHGLPRRIRW